VAKKYLGPFPTPELDQVTFTYSDDYVKVPGGVRRVRVIKSIQMGPVESRDPAASEEE
tara:strand:- start:356 stop:529 length:174 start_codon:yes stop_codon:yes gene_type:complete